MNKIFLDNTERNNEFSIHPLPYVPPKGITTADCGPICHRFPGDGWKV